MNILITGANNYIAKDLINFFSKKKTNLSREIVPLNLPSAVILIQQK